MKRFRPIIIDYEKNFFLNTEYISSIFFLYIRYSRYLDDDYALDGRGLFKYFVENIQNLSPYFWIIFDEKAQVPAGFVYLDKLTGDSNHLHSGEVSACFFKKYWGGFTLETAKKFYELCFEKLGLTKLKAEIYPQNYLVKTLLKKSGFKKEGYLKAETIRRGKLQDIEIYSLIKER